MTSPGYCNGWAWLAEAEAEYRAVLEAYTRVNGPDDPDTLVTRRRLAAVLADQDRVAEAETEQRAVLAAYERVLSGDDLTTLAVRYDLAVILHRQGRWLRLRRSTGRYWRPRAA